MRVTIGLGGLDKKEISYKGYERQTVELTRHNHNFINHNNIYFPEITESENIPVFYALIFIDEKLAHCVEQIRIYTLVKTDQVFFCPGSIQIAQEVMEECLAN